MYWLPPGGPLIRTTKLNLQRRTTGPPNKLIFQAPRPNNLNPRVKSRVATHRAGEITQRAPEKRETRPEILIRPRHGVARRHLNRPPKRVMHATTPRGRNYATENREATRARRIGGLSSAARHRPRVIYALNSPSRSYTPRLLILQVRETEDELVSPGRFQVRGGKNCRPAFNRYARQPPFLSQRGFIAADAPGVCVNPRARSRGDTAGDAGVETGFGIADGLQ